MIQARTSSLAIVLVLTLCGCGDDDGSNGTGGTKVGAERAGTYVIDADAFLRAYVDGKVDAWPDLSPADQERERGRLKRAAKVGFEALEVSLHLAEDGTFLFSRRLRISGVAAVRARGTWRASGDGITLEVTHENGRARLEPRTVSARFDGDALHLTWDDGELPAFVLRRVASPA